MATKPAQFAYGNNTKRIPTPSGGFILFDEDETPVARTCIVCKGNFQKKVEEDGKYRVVMCRWCDGGLMSQQTIINYLTHPDHYQLDQGDKLFCDDEIEKLLRDYVEG